MPRDIGAGLNKLDVERNYGREFANLLNGSHHDLCVFRKAACPTDLFAIPKDAITHIPLLKSRWEALTHLDEASLPKLASTSALFAQSGGQSLDIFLTDPKRMLEELGVRHPDLKSDSLTVGRATRFLLAVTGWSTPGASSSEESLKLPTGVSPPRPVESLAGRSGTLIACRWCRRVVNLAFFQHVEATDADIVEESGDSLTEQRRKLRKTGDDSSFAVHRATPQEFDPVQQHRWYCPWVCAAANSQDQPGYLLVARAVTTPSSGLVTRAPEATRATLPTANSDSHVDAQTLLRSASFSSI